MLGLTTQLWGQISTFIVDWLVASLLILSDLTDGLNEIAVIGLKNKTESN